MKGCTVIADHGYDANHLRDWLGEAQATPSTPPRKNRKVQFKDDFHHVYWEERLVIEGSGGVGIAAHLADKITNPGKCMSLISGQNIDLTPHKRIIDLEDVDLAAEV